MTKHGPKWTRRFTLKVIYFRLSLSNQEDTFGQRRSFLHESEIDRPIRSLFSFVSSIPHIYPVESSCSRFRKNSLFRTKPAATFRGSRLAAIEKTAPGRARFIKVGENYNF